MNLINVFTFGIDRLVHAAQRIERESSWHRRSISYPGRAASRARIRYHECELTTSHLPGLIRALEAALPGLSEWKDHESPLGFFRWRVTFDLRFPAKREHLKRCSELCLECQGQNLALNVLYVP